MFEAQQASTQLCTGCPKMCRHVCPVANAERRESVTPAMKMAALDMARRGTLNVLEDVAETSHACTGCGACARFCLLGVRPGEALVDARADLAAASASPLAARMAGRMQQSGNPTGADLHALARQQLPVRPERASGGLALFAGCTSLRRLPEHDADSLAALEAATGGKLAVIPKDPSASCCGYPLWAAGLVEQFVANARRVAVHLADRGTVVTSDPGCLHTMRALYAQHGVALPVRVLHTTEVLARVTVRPSGDAGPWLYHDPCHLGRHQGVYQAPRTVLEAASGAPVAEMTWSREHAQCSGGGALYPQSNPDGALEAARLRINNEVDELARVPGARLATACPTCQVQFARSGQPAHDVAAVVLGRRSPAAVREGRGRG